MTFDFLNELEEQLDALLMESRGVGARKVNDAINNQYRVQIKYNDNLKRRKRGQKQKKRSKAPTGYRLIEPYVFGISKLDNKVIRAFQYSGATRRGVPKWKLFRTDRIIDWVPLPKSHFYVDPAQLYSLVPDYNPEGDKSMVKILNQVKIEKPKLEPIPQREEGGEWESPVDLVKRQGSVASSNIDKQKTIVKLDNQQDKSDDGAIDTKGLNKSLKNQNNDNFDDMVNAKLGITKQQYDRDSMSAQQRHDAEINRRRDNRWKNAADNRRMWRRDSANDNLLNMDTYFSQEPDLETKYGEQYYDDTYDDLYEPDNYKRK